mgnify:CR=1 FL=1
MEKLDNIVMYSPEDVRKLLHLGNTKCLELFNSEDFPSIKIGRAFWVKADCLEMKLFSNGQINLQKITIYRNTLYYTVVYIKNFIGTRVKQGSFFLK